MFLECFVEQDIFGEVFEVDILERFLLPAQLASDFGGFCGQEVLQTVGTTAVLAMGHHAGLAQTRKGRPAQATKRFLF